MMFIFLLTQVLTVSKPMPINAHLTKTEELMDMGLPPPPTRNNWIFQMKWTLNIHLSFQTIYYWAILC